MNGNGSSKSEGKNDGFSKHAIAVASLSALLGSVGGPPLLIAVGGPNFFAPDRFTGSDAKMALAPLEQRVETLEMHVNNHPDGPLRAAIAAVRADIAAGDAERKLIIKNQDRILDRLDNK